jgi:hypothetical protein
LAYLSSVKEEEGSEGEGEKGREAGEEWRGEEGEVV